MPSSLKLKTSSAFFSCNCKNKRHFFCSTFVIIPITIILPWLEPVVLKGKIDSGAYMSSISQTIAKQLGVAYTTGPPCGPTSYAANGTEVLGYGLTALTVDVEDSAQVKKRDQFTFKTSDMGPGREIILGRDWIARYQPECNWVDRGFRWPSITASVRGPHPKLKIQLRVLDANGRQHKVSALLDTGASSSCIPRKEQERLELIKIGPSTDSNAINGTNIASFGTFRMLALIEDDMTAPKETIA